LQHPDLLFTPKPYTSKRLKLEARCVPGTQSTTAADTTPRNWSTPADLLHMQSVSWSDALESISE
jgi:hypothetical protein